MPHQQVTGVKPKLLGISKRGIAYLRGLFINGARAALASVAKTEDAPGRWLRKLLARRQHNSVVAAFTSKLAHEAWVGWTDNTSSHHSAYQV